MTAARQSLPSTRAADSGLDTGLDAVAAVVRAHPPLGLERVAELLADLAAHPGAGADAELVTHHLSVALDAAIARHAAGVDVLDLFQEASLAMVASVQEYAARGASARGLVAALRASVDAHLDGVAAAESRRRAMEEAFLHDSRILELAEIELRRSLGRPASTAELASLLKWTEERVALVSRLLADARLLNDESLLPFLDDDDGGDEDDEAGGGPSGGGGRRRRVADPDAE